MKRILVLVTLVFVASAIAGSPQDTEKRKVTCKMPANAGTCYWTRGRLSLYNGGNPNLRLWKIGTHRILGIFSGPGAGPLGYRRTHEDEVELPPSLMKHDFTKASVFGDFEVCPLAPEKEEHMQPACIESVKNIVLEKN
jgi:hypothetical protein